MSLSYLQIRNPKDDETPVEAATQIFSSILPSTTTVWKSLFDKNSYPAFEIYLLSQTILFYITVPEKKDAYARSLVSSSYPSAKVTATTDPLTIVQNSPAVAVGELELKGGFHLPIKTYQEFANIDPMQTFMGFLAKTPPGIKASIQLLATPASFGWQKAAKALTKPPAEGEKAASDDKSQIAKKTTAAGCRVLIRLMIGAPDIDTANGYMSSLAGTFAAYASGEGNRIGFCEVKKPLPFIERMATRSATGLEHRQQILNAIELASIWHLPGKQLAGLRNIAWGKTLSGEPPENIPISEGVSSEEKQDINFFAKTEFKNKEQIFGLRAPDRRKHVYIIGKTGTGKSTLIANMAIDDVRRDRGIGIIDPHGDLSETILEYIPKRRINDVVYLEPFDLYRPFHLNILEITNPEQKHLVASGIISIFYKIYGASWGPRLEYIFRNIILTLIEVEGTTLMDVLTILIDNKYRKFILDQVNDPVLQTFWEKEYNSMPDKMKTESISPIQNKVGQFVTNPMIRNIIGHSKSTINLAEIMDEGKILIVNLSQGKLGEDNAALLGAMFITKIQQAAMARSFKKESERQDFFLYVDEFQNFATNSFVKILSEARKYRLALTLANQFIDQLDEEIGNAIFGNIGSLISFVVGAKDAEKLSTEFQGLYTKNDLVSLGKYEIVLKLSIENMTSAPFPAFTLPLPAMKNDNVDEIIEISKTTYGREIVQTPVSAESTLPSQTSEQYHAQQLSERNAAPPGGGRDDRQGGGGGGYQQRDNQSRGGGYSQPRDGQRSDYTPRRNDYPQGGQQTQSPLLGNATSIHRTPQQQGQSAPRQDDRPRQQYSDDRPRYQGGGQNRGGGGGQGGQRSGGSGNSGGGRDDRQGGGGGQRRPYKPR